MKVVSSLLLPPQRRQQHRQFFIYKFYCVVTVSCFLEYTCCTSAYTADDATARRKNVTHINNNTNKPHETDCGWCCFNVDGGESAKIRGWLMQFWGALQLNHDDRLISRAHKFFRDVCCGWEAFEALNEGNMHVHIIQVVVWKLGEISTTSV